VHIFSTVISFVCLLSNICCLQLNATSKKYFSCFIFLACSAVAHLETPPPFRTTILKGHSHKFSWRFYSLQCIINAILITKRQNDNIIWPVKRGTKLRCFIVCKHGSIHLYRHVNSMQIRYYTLLNLPFKCIFECANVRLVPCLHSGDFRVLYLKFNSRSGIHIPCVH
jgi:hypothetical protein